MRNIILILLIAMSCVKAQAQCFAYYEVPFAFADTMYNNHGPSSGEFNQFTYSVLPDARVLVDTGITSVFPDQFATLALTGWTPILSCIFYWDFSTPASQYYIYKAIADVNNGVIPHKDIFTAAGDTTYCMPAGRLLMLYRLSPTSDSSTVSVGTTLGGTDIYPTTTIHGPVNVASNITYDTTTTIYVTSSRPCKHTRMKL